MRIAVFGLGYVGCVSAACLAEAGHLVTGVDVNPVKVDLINAGQSPIIEDEMEELVREAVAAGRLHATQSAEAAVAGSDISLICVGTPSRDNGSLDLCFVENVAREIGGALASSVGYHVVAVRSTVLPGTLEEHVIPLLEANSGGRVGTDFGVGSNPEFLREGSAVRDFHNPPFTVIGQWDEHSGDRIAALYRHIDAPVERTDIRTAEMMKYVCNVFHALKVTFANEIGNIAHRLGVDSHEVMRIFALDTKLNISAAYLKPGYAFGGSCLPKDLRALLYAAKHADMDTPVLEAIPISNELQARRGVELVMRTGKKRVGILGLSFKAGTDDLRESPMVYLVETLLGKGYDLKVYDRNVSLARLTGANKDYIERVIPHISSLMSSSVEEVVEHAEVLVIGNRSPIFADVVSRANSHVIIDLVRVNQDVSQFGDGYAGICW